MKKGKPFLLLQKVIFCRNRFLFSSACACVFIIKTGIMTTRQTDTGSFCKKVCLAFSLEHFIFSESFLSGLCQLPNFFTIFSILLNILLVSVYIHVIKTITWNLADVWHTIFPSDPPNILSCVGIGIGYKIVVKLKSWAQPMHLMYAIKYCFLLKTSWSE